MKKLIKITLCIISICVANLTHCSYDFSQYGLYFGRLNHLKNSAAFQQAEQNAQYVVFKFSSNTCGPCQQLTPIMKQLSSEFKNILFIEIEIGMDEFDLLKSNYNIRRVPTVILFKDGVKEHRKNGTQTKTYWTDVIQNSFD